MTSLVVEASQLTITVGGRIIVGTAGLQLTTLNSTDSLLANNNIFSYSVKYNLAKLETKLTVILPPTVSGL